MLINTLETSDSATQTVELLQSVYNGTNATKMQMYESANLRKEHLMPSIRLFMQFVRNYQEEPDVGYDALIGEEIARSSIFAAFKRKIIRDDPELSVIFADALK